MDTPIIYQGEESSQLSKKTIDINDGNLYKMLASSIFLLFGIVLSIIFIPNLLGKILCPVIVVIIYIYDRKRTSHSERFIEQKNNYKGDELFMSGQSDINF